MCQRGTVIANHQLVIHLLTLGPLKKSTWGYHQIQREEPHYNTWPVVKIFENNGIPNNECHICSWLNLSSVVRNKLHIRNFQYLHKFDMFLCVSWYRIRDVLCSILSPNWHIIDHQITNKYLIYHNDILNLKMFELFHRSRVMLDVLLKFKIYTVVNASSAGYYAPALPTAHP